MDFSLADPELELHSRPDVPDLHRLARNRRRPRLRRPDRRVVRPIRWEPLEIVEHGRHLDVRAHIVANGVASGARSRSTSHSCGRLATGCSSAFRGFPTIEEAYATAAELDRASPRRRLAGGEHHPPDRQDQRRSRRRRQAAAMPAPSVAASTSGSADSSPTGRGAYRVSGSSIPLSSILPRLSASKLLRQQLPGLAGDQDAVVDSRVAASTRAATLTASPMTEKLSRPAPPIEPATTWPVLTPTPTRSSPASPSVVDRPRDLARRADRAVGVVGERLGRAEHRQQPVALELVDVAAVAGDDRDDHLEQPVERRDDLLRRRVGGEAR